MILFISDFDMRGSGYMNIAVSLCNQLAMNHGRQVTALGIGYDKSEHNWPFSILPISPSEYMSHIPAEIHNLISLGREGRWTKPEAIVVALDIPLQERMLQMDRQGLPYIGIFPIESGPLCNSWALSVSMMTEKLVISQFGEKMIEDAGVDSTYLPVGIDSESWRPPAIIDGKSERETIRESLGIKEGEFIVLTVADNQERKNLAVAAESIARLRSKGVDAKWILVTRVLSPVGWKLDDLAAQFDITEAVTKYDRGLPFDRLWFLYAAADAFLLTSKAEGLCMPILESMACATPVVATNATAIPEHIYEEPDWSRVKDGKWGKGKPRKQRGWPIDVAYTSIDPWGNSVRSFADPESAAKAMKYIYNNPKKVSEVTTLALAYARTRTWDKAGRVLEDALARAIAASAPVGEEPAQPAGSMPDSMPRPVPVVGGKVGEV